MGNTNNQNNGNSNSGKVVETSTASVLRFVLQAGGANADVIATATDEEINVILEGTPKVKILF